MVLGKRQVEKFRKILEEMRVQLTRTVKGATEEAQNIDESSGYSQHQADEGTDDFDRTVSLEVTSKEFGILKQIDRALEKINDNTYGVCDITGDDIPVARLEAVPYATMTVDAQDKLEKGLL